MRKLIILLIIILLLPGGVRAINTSASSYILMDMDTNRVLLSKNKDEKRLIASITKIMTCMLAIESNRLDETVIVDDSILKSYGSGIYIQVGEEITLRDLLYGLMLRSGNDAALMIANYVGMSEEKFVDMMNKRALELGMKNTIFSNSSGLDNEYGNYSTAYDMAILTSYAMKYDEYRKIVSTKKYVLKTNYKTYIWYNKNKLLSLDYINGGKTGFTEKARRTLVTTSFKDRMNFVVVTLNDSGDWNTHKSLHEYAFSNYNSYKVLDKNKYRINEENYYHGNVYIKDDVYLTLNNDEIKNVVNNIKLNKLKNYHNNDLVGTNNLYLNSKLIYTSNIFVLKHEKQNKKNESLWDRILRWFK